jgi:histidine triad (HIT) family protein
VFIHEGISTRQHNEPAGDQDVWHLHVHVFARQHGDEPYRRHGEADFVPLRERAPWAAHLCDQFSDLSAEPVAR